MTTKTKETKKMSVKADPTAEMKKELKAQVADARAVQVAKEQAPTLADMGYSLDDILIAGLTVCQPLSSAVTEGKASPGDIYDFTSKQVVAKRGELLELIPLFSRKTWITRRRFGDAWKYVSQAPITPDTEGLPLEWAAGNDTYRRDRVLSFFFLVPKMLSSGENPFPVKVSFSRTGMTAGKALVNHEIKMRMAGGKLPFERSVNLGVEMVKNEKGTFFVPSITNGQAVPPETVSLGAMWRGTLMQGNVRTDESDLAGDEHGGTTVIHNDGSTQALY